MIKACGVSDAGRVRPINEDALISDTASNLFAVADGMGGHRAGEVASQLALEAVAAFVQRSSEDADFTWPYGIADTLSFDGNRVRTAILLANRRVFRAAESREEYTGMGSTIVAVLANHAHVAIGSVGDSRLYILSGDKLTQVTRDDSWVAAVLASDPTLTPEQIAVHPMRNVLTSVLGAQEQVHVHVSEHTLAVGDLLLLCSDGLHRTLEADRIIQLMSTGAEVERLAHALVDAALEAGSRDNVTALVARYEKD